MKHKLILILFLIVSMIIFAACSSIPDQPEVTSAPAEEQVIEEEVVETQVPTEIPEETAETVDPTETIAVVEEPTAEEIVEDSSSEVLLLLETSCTDCHGMNRTTAFSGSVDEWTEIVERMIRKGAELSDAEKDLVIKYLAETYP